MTGAQFTVRLPHEPGSIPLARRALARLTTEVDELTLRHTRLLVSELVTNAVRHVPATEQDQIELRVHVRDDALRVEVVDCGQGFDPPTPRELRDGASGWGLHIVTRLSSRWGIEREGGARVWFELDRAPS